MVFLFREQIETCLIDQVQGCRIIKPTSVVNNEIHQYEFQVLSVCFLTFR